MIPTWVAVVTGISLAILALSAIAIAVSSVAAALGVRAFLRVMRDLAGPAVGDVRQLVGTIRSEAESVVGTSRELRERIVKAADAAQTRLADLDALFEVVQEEVESTVLDAAASVRMVRRGLAVPRRGARLDAGHARVSGRLGAREPAPAARTGGGSAARVPLRLPVRQHRRGHVDREEVRPRGAALSRLARGTGDLQPGAHGPAPGVRPRLPLAPRGRFGGAQFLRAAPAAAHLQHDGAGPQLLGEPVRDPSGGGVCQGGEGGHSPGPRAQRRASRL